VTAQPMHPADLVATPDVLPRADVPLDAHVLPGHEGRRGRRFRRCGDGGSATVAAVGVIAVLLLLTGSALTLSSAVLASHRARSAADLASLAGASALMRGEPPSAACARAAAAARRGDAQLLSCRAAGAQTLTVRAGVRPSLAILGPFGQARASARAGPPASARD
jgi:secretion/DNA translocation related TadE-like protein